MSASTWETTEKASRIRIPDEKFLSFRSTKSSSSAISMISSKRDRASRGSSPIITPLSSTLSRAVSSLWNPTPRSMIGATRPATQTPPESG